MVFWFSGTGNSYWAASEMARCLSDRLVSIAEAVDKGEYEYTLSHGEAIGIVCPVYYWGIPAMVKEFCSKLSFPGGKHYLWVCLTCGGSACSAVNFIREYLEVDYWQELRMPDNYVLLNDVRHRDEIRANLFNAGTEIGRLYNAVRRREKMDIDKKAFLFSAFISKKAYPSYDKNRVTSKFYATDACTGCGVCEKNCPDHAIEIRDGRPVWVKEKCEFCLGCLHRCPAKALQYTKRTEKKGRYLHPILKEKDPNAGPFDV